MEGYQMSFWQARSSGDGGIVLAGSAPIRQKRAFVAGTSSEEVSGFHSAELTPAGSAISAVSISRLPVRHPE
jgi:hypothetical protein